MNKLFSIFNIRRLIECRPITTRITAEGKDIPKKKNTENRITLISTDNSISITDLKSAQSLSDRRDLKLVKIQDVDSKARRPVYRLMSNTEYHEEELINRKEKQAARQNSSMKGEKLLTLSSKIAEHDLMTGVKKMMKLLEKQYLVKVVISGEGGETQQSESIYSVIEKNIKTVGKVVQKRSKGNSLRFQLQPIKESSGQAANDSESKDGNDKGPL